MKILLDENCSYLREYLKDRLEGLGCGVLIVKEAVYRKVNNNGIVDEQILICALENNYIIVTKDNGLKIRCEKRGIPFIDIGSPEAEAKIVENKVKEMSALKGYL